MCANDSDCTSGANGRCDCLHIGATTQQQNACTYDDCGADTDCHGGVCICRESPVHVPQYYGSRTVCLGGGNCRTDRDCGNGGYCSPAPQPGCGAQYWLGYFCHTSRDECVDDTDCSEANAYCAYDTTASRWICSTGMCEVG
jgi:hypothetical protein